jgi:hypothetical protein
MLAKWIGLIVCAAAIGIGAAWLVNAWQGPTHNIGVLFQLLLVAALGFVVAVLAGWFLFLRGPSR